MYRYVCTRVRERKTFYTNVHTHTHTLIRPVLVKQPGNFDSRRLTFQWRVSWWGFSSRPAHSTLHHCSLVLTATVLHAASFHLAWTHTHTQYRRQQRYKCGGKQRHTYKLNRLHTHTHKARKHTNKGKWLVLYITLLPLANSHGITRPLSLTLILLFSHL